MSTFNTISPKDYTIEEFHAHSPMSWELTSGSGGIYVTSPVGFIGAITIDRATNDPDEFFAFDSTPKINESSGIYEHVMYSSIKHLFYTNALFFNGAELTSSSLATLSDNSYVISIGQYFYGERVNPNSFELTLDALSDTVFDDGYGNLFISQSGVGYYLGNIFYDHGIAVIAHDTASTSGSIDTTGIKIVGGTEIYIDYESDVKIDRHQINVRLDPSMYNFSLFNPSMRSMYYITSSVTQSFHDLNVPESSSSYWGVYNLMGAGIVKPYVTTIGLYNDKYELLVVAKVSTPIQRTFDVEQIFTIRFDV